MIPLRSVSNIRPRFQVSVVGTVWMWGQRETSTLLGTSSAMSNLTALSCLQRLLQVLERGVLYNTLENSVGCSLEEHLAYPLLKCMTNFIFFIKKKKPKIQTWQKTPINLRWLSCHKCRFLPRFAGWLPCSFLTSWRTQSCVKFNWISHPQSSLVLWFHSADTVKNRLLSLH